MMCYDVTVYNLLWIADYCVTGTFSTRRLSYAYPRTFTACRLSARCATEWS